jgi:hypothetical protein
MGLKSSHWYCVKAWFKSYTSCSTTFLVRPSSGAQQSHERAPKKCSYDLERSKFCQQVQSFVCVPPWRRVTFKFWEMLKNACSEVTLVPKKYLYPESFELCAKFRWMQSKPCWRYSYNTYCLLFALRRKEIREQGVECCVCGLLMSSKPIFRVTISRREAAWRFITKKDNVLFGCCSWFQNDILVPRRAPLSPCCASSIVLLLPSWAAISDQCANPWVPAICYCNFKNSITYYIYTIGVRAVSINRETHEITGIPSVQRHSRWRDTATGACGDMVQSDFCLHFVPSCNILLLSGIENGIKYGCVKDSPWPFF